MLGFWPSSASYLGVSIGVIIVKLLAYLSSQAIAAMREESAEDENNKNSDTFVSLTPPWDMGALCGYRAFSCLC